MEIFVRSPRPGDILLSHLLIRLILGFSEEADILDESGLDVFIVHELTEDVKLLAQELVSEVDLINTDDMC